MISRNSKRQVNPVERVLNLLTLLSRATTPMTRAQIVDAMARGESPYPTDEDPQRQLFTSDKNVITRDLGIPVRTVAGLGDEAGQMRYYIHEDDMCVPDLDLTDDELSILSLALESLHHTIPQAGEALMKFDGRLGTSPMSMNIGLPVTVVRMSEAAKQRQVVRVSHAGETLDIEPLRVVFDKGTWYVIASLRRDKKTRALRCSQLADDYDVLDDEPTPGRRRLTDRELRRLLHAAEQDDFVATVRVDRLGASMSWWDRRVIETEPLADGGLRIAVTVDDRARFRGWLLGLGTHAVVEGPRDLRDHVIQWLEDAARPVTVVPEAPARPSAPTTRPGPRPLGERLQRLLSILPWLRNTTSTPIAVLAARVGVSEAMLLKDLEAASMCGVPPYTSDALFDFWVEGDTVHFCGDSSVTGRFRRSRALLTRSVKLTPRQVTAVSLGLAVMAAALDESQRESGPFASLKRKVEAALGEIPVEIRLEDAPLLTEMNEMVREHRAIRVTYMNGEEQISERVLHPRLVFVDKGETYLMADDVSAVPVERDRVFRVDRILHTEATGDTFEHRESTWSGWGFRGDVTEAVLYIAPGNGWLVDRVASKACVVNDDDSMFVWVDVVSRTWLAKLLVRCGHPSCVVSPPELRDVSAQWADSVVRHYRA
jgi:predicted DNA-binding transcriptional regulator YafY